MKLSRATSYALLATLELAQLSHRGPLTCAHIAANTKLPHRFLFQVLRDLVRHGILCSTQGADGGYFLARPANQTSLLEVIEAIEGPFDAALGLGDGLPSETQMKLRRPLEVVTATTRRQLSTVKLSQFSKPPARRKVSVRR